MFHRKKKHIAMYTNLTQWVAKDWWLKYLASRHTYHYKYFFMSGNTWGNCCFFILNRILLGPPYSLWPRDIIWWHNSGSTLAQIMACCQTVSSRCLHQYWFPVSDDRVLKPVFYIMNTILLKVHYRHISQGPKSYQMSSDVCRFCVYFAYYGVLLR